MVVLARELSLEQIAAISRQIEEQKICGPAGELVKIEMFAHGAMCMSMSGKCYLSEHESHHSANRGACRQICRRKYTITDKDSGQQLDIDGQYVLSPKDLCTIEFMDKIIEAGVSVFKIEGRARSAEYVKKVTAAYRAAADAVIAGTYTPEYAASLKEGVSEVFNRGFWDGYYQGARLGEWSDVYGSKATKKKTYVGKVTNYFANIGVAEILVETGEINVGQNILIIGPSTGVIEMQPEEIRVDLVPADKAVKGEKCSIAVPERLRRSDKVYIFE